MKRSNDPLDKWERLMRAQQDADRLQQLYNAQQQKAQRNLANQLNGKGAGMAVSNYANNFASQYAAAQALQQLGGKQMSRPQPPKTMNPPIHATGSKVTVRTGKTEWTILNVEVRNDPYNGSTILYYLQDENGRQTREEERDLRVVAAPISKKAQVNFDTVIISDEKRNQILEALEQVNQMELIFTTWGFGETIEKGKGVSMLFWGPPGTGKTLMAQAIANKLGYTLKVISTADIESSAPGEAERNIRKHFEEAKDGKSILLFDECDSLIFSRAGTGPILSAQINELLSQIERFDGITLFTTNRLGTLDEAVNRRLALKLEFAMPSQAERAEIWKRMFPVQAPLDAAIDWMLLAEFEITGGYIKNAVLRAARMAATEKIPNSEKKIAMKHLKRALRLEIESMNEFEEARLEHEGKTGHFVRTSQGRKLVTGNDMVRKRGGIEKVSS